MMPKIIDLEINGIQCDAPGCGYRDAIVGRDYYPAYLNYPCPDCGANLLTVQDLLAVMRVERAYARVNRWFGWLGWFGIGREKINIPMEMNGTGSMKFDIAGAMMEKAE